MTFAEFRSLGDTEKIKIGTTTTTSLIATAEVTQGRFGLYHHHMLPGASGAAPHFHTRISESFYVLSGTATLHDGNEWRPAEAGDFLHVPENAVHGFRNDGPEPVAMLILFTPAEAREGYFRELGELLSEGRVPSTEEMTALMIKYDQVEV